LTVPRENLIQSRKELHPLYDCAAKLSSAEQYINGHAAFAAVTAPKQENMTAGIRFCRAINAREMVSTNPRTNALHGTSGLICGIPNQI
jgi:hypothetical protein